MSETPAETTPEVEAPQAELAAASASSDARPAVFVEPPELADGAEPSGSPQNGQGTSTHQPTTRSRPNQGQNQNNRNNQGNNNQGNNQNNNQGNNNQGNNQSDGGDLGNRRGRRRRGRERGVGGELQWWRWTGAAVLGARVVDVKGMLDLRDEGYGFLRCGGYLPSPKDVYISISQARRFALRKGDYVEGACRPASNNEKYPALLPHRHGIRP